MGHSTERTPWWWLLVAALAALGLTASNPSEQDFEAFAAEQLVERISAEFCGHDGLPLVAQLVIRNCPGLILSQRTVLGRLAGQATRRYNAGLFSLYETELGGQHLMPGLSVPRYRALTLAGAGQLLILHTSSQSAADRS